MSPETPNPDADSLPRREEFERLCKQANSGAPRALEDLRAFLDSHPAIWQTVGDLAQHSQLTLIRLVAQNNLLLTESITLKVAAMRQELAGDHPTLLENLCIDCIANSWLELQYAHNSRLAEPGKNLPLARFLDRTKASAQRRLETATKSLLLVRDKLAQAACASSRPNLKVRWAPKMA